MFIVICRQFRTLLVEGGRMRWCLVSFCNLARVVLVILQVSQFGSFGKCVNTLHTGRF